jgi:hypothetical protein
VAARDRINPTTRRRITIGTGCRGKEDEAIAAWQRATVVNPGFARAFQPGERLGRAGKAGGAGRVA